MIISIFAGISDFFLRVKNSIPFREYLPIFFAGVLVGIILLSLFYILFIFVSFSRNEKENKKNIEIDDDEIKNIIENTKNKFNEEASMLPMSQKFNELKCLSWEMIQDIASIYYPKSKYPVYEVSIDELILLIHYITDRIDSLFSGRMLKKIKKYRVSSVLKIVEAKKKYDDTKVVKMAKKTHISRVSGIVLNAINPFYWMRKLVVDVPFVKIPNRIAIIIIDIVSQETVNIYSKSVFKEDDDVEFQKLVKQVEEMIEENEYEEEKQ